ncbi:hypothetical protein BDR22DRAFT_891903 [Usnea florida]
MSYPPSMQLHQSLNSVLPPTPPAQQDMPYSLPMLPNQSSMPYSPWTPQVHGTFQYPPSMLPYQMGMPYSPQTPQLQGTLPYQSFMLPNQSSMPYSPPTPQANGALQYPSYMLSNQSGMLSSPPMAQLQGTFQYPSSMLEGHTVNMATLSPSPALMQTVLPYRPQTRPSLSATSQQRLTLPTPNTIPVDQIAPMPKTRRKLVWAVCIPCDGARMHQKMFEIIADIDTGRHVPMLKNWWPEQDRKARPMNLSLYALDPLPLGGNYLLFTIIDATRIPRNPHLGHRIRGDAYLFKVNQLQVDTGVEQPNLEHAIYEDVPGDLLTSPLLKEMTQAMEWKVFSPYNVVQVGRVRAQMREREMIEQREKEQRLRSRSEYARDSQLMQMDVDATNSQEKHGKNRSKEEKKREREDTMRQHQRMVQMKDEQMKNDTRAWEQKNGNKRREGMDQEGREYEMDEQQHVSPSTSPAVPPKSSEPSPKRRQPVTPKSTPSRVRKSTLRSSVKKTPSSKSKSKKSAPHNITIESVQEHVAALDNIGASHGVPEAAGAENQGITAATEGTVSNNDPFVMSFEERNGFVPMEIPAFEETAGWSFEHGSGFTSMGLPIPDDVAEASLAQPEGFEGFGGEMFDGSEDLFPAEGSGVGGGDEVGFQ